MLTAIDGQLHIYLSRPLTSQFCDVVFDFFFQAEFLLTSKERLHLKRALQQYELNRYGLISALRLFIYFIVVRPFVYLRAVVQTLFDLDLDFSLSKTIATLKDKTLQAIRHSRLLKTHH